MGDYRRYNGSKCSPVTKFINSLQAAPQETLTERGNGKVQTFLAAALFAVNYILIFCLNLRFFYCIAAISQINFTAGGETVKVILLYYGRYYNSNSVTCHLPPFPSSTRETSPSHGVLSSLTSSQMICTLLSWNTRCCWRPFYYVTLRLHRCHTHTNPSWSTSFSPLQNSDKYQINTVKPYFY